MTDRHHTDPDLQRLNARFRAIAWTGLAAVVVTLVLWLMFPSWRPVWNGLLLGEAGGAYVVYSMIRQGHLKDGLQGTALFASGMLGLFTRLVVLVVVIVAAEKMPRVNVYAALVGYLLGFVWIIVGMYGFAKSRGTIAGRSR
jgi:hypothetical protein